MLRENHSSVPVAGLLFRWQGTVKHSEDSAEETTNPSGEKENYVQQHKASLYRKSVILKIHSQ